VLAGGLDVAAVLPKYINLRRGAYAIAILSVLPNPWQQLASGSTFLAVLSAYAVCVVIILSSIDPANPFSQIPGTHDRPPLRPLLDHPTPHLPLARPLHRLRPLLLLVHLRRRLVHSRGLMSCRHPLDAGLRARCESRAAGPGRRNTRVQS